MHADLIEDSGEQLYRLYRSRQIQPPQIHVAWWPRRPKEHFGGGTLVEIRIRSGVRRGQKDLQQSNAVAGLTDP
jgi:hypothetical protein